MKIEDLVVLLPPSGRPSSPRPEPGEFAQRLQEAVTGRQPQGPVCAQGLSGLAETAPPAPGPAGAAAAVEPALDRLEAFAKGLQDAGRNLKDLAPLAKALERDSRRLAALCRSLDTASPLRPLVEEAAALAYVESVKFQRGDYL